jgi:hypothetical protein
MLSNQAAENGAKQFNAKSENQRNQFMTQLAWGVEQFNTAQLNAMEQSNVAEQNRIAAVNAQNQTEISKANAALQTEVNKFNAEVEFQRDRWNAANAQAVQQSNIDWRRQANTLDTAATNAANQRNVQNAFNLDSAEQAFIWQNLRDEASYIREAYENEEQRKTVMYSTALQNEQAAGKGSSTTSTLMTLIANIFK